MSVKTLRKQLFAAIAMVLVAAIALGSSTYAWFVSNNQVTAKTASISAQSNAPFLMIAKTGDTLTTTSATQEAGTEDKVELYPAQWSNEVTSGTYQFESAYAKKADNTEILNGSRFAVGGVDAPNRKDYALKQSFDIGTNDTKAGSFQNLKVANVAIDAGDNSTDLVEAMTILVKCGDNWGVYKKSSDSSVTDAVELTVYGDTTTTVTNNLTGKSGSSVNDAIVDTIAAGANVTVDIYVFYDGSETTVYTENLPNLKNCGVTVTFTATPVNTDGDVVNAPNAANA